MSTPRNWPYPGSGWWKFDFHTHTPFSRDTPWHPLVGTPEELTPEAWLQRYMDAGIDCVAITDHNGGGWIDGLKEAYERMRQVRGPNFRELFLFPGVEISVSGGFHLLVIFDLPKSQNDIVSLLGAVGFPAHLHGQTDSADDVAVTRESAIKVIEEIVRVGGLAIPAHADSEKGLLRLKDGTTTKSALDSNTVRLVFECPHVIAAEIVGSGVPKPAIYTQAKCNWAEVLGSDCHNFRNEPKPGSRYTWIKMEKPSLKGLRLALLDGNGVSIRRSDETGDFDPYATPEHFIESIEISGARKMGLKAPERFDFNPWFNALVGGRGTGKSTVVHFSRLAYRRESELQEPLLGKEDPAARTFSRFAQKPDREGAGGLSTDDKTVATVTVMRDGVLHRLTWRQKDNRVTVEQRVGDDWRLSQSQDVTRSRFPLRLFSQGQLASLASDRGHALLDIIDQSIGAVEAKQKTEDERQRFLSLRARIRELDGKLAGRNALVVQLEDVKRKLDRFAQAQHAEVLQSFQRRSRQEREVHRQLDNARDISERIRSLASELHAEDLPGQLFEAADEADRSALGSVQRLHQAIEVAVEGLQREAKRLSEQVQADEKALSSSPWQEALRVAKQRYQDLSATLKEQGVSDPSEYGKLVQERQRLDGELAKLDSLIKQRETLEQQASECLTQVAERRRALSGLRRDFLEQALADNRFVQVRLEVYGRERDAEEVERSLRAAIDDQKEQEKRFSADLLILENDQPKQGIVASLLRNLPKLELEAEGEIEQRLQTIKQRLADTCTGKSKAHFGGHFTNYLENKFKERPEFLDRLLTWFPEDSLDVQYSHGGDGKNFRPIGQGSAGQKAAAMLAFLLAHGTEPIILDQPEDDLDNHLIYELVVQQIRANKQRRQIIAITHNPNIVVNGDAEMIHAMTSNGRECRISKRGALQDHEVREEVCTVMEGGREAFEQRYRRLSRR